MLRLTIEFDPQTGDFRMEAPPEKPMAIYMMAIAQKLLLEQPSQGPVVPDAKLASQLLAKPR